MTGINENNLLNQIYSNQKVNGQFTSKQQQNVKEINKIVNNFIEGKIASPQQAAQQIMGILGKGGEYIPLWSNRNWESFNLDIQCKNGAKLTIKIENGYLNDSFKIQHQLTEQSTPATKPATSTTKQPDRIDLGSIRAEQQTPITTTINTKLLDNIFTNPQLAQKCKISIYSNKIVIKVPQGNAKDQYYEELQINNTQAEKLINNYYSKMQTTPLSKGELDFVAKLMQLTTQLNINQNFNFNKTEFSQSLQPIMTALQLINSNKTDFQDIQYTFNLLQDFIASQPNKATSIKEFLNNFQEQYADILPDSAKKMIADFINGNAQPSNQQAVFNNLMNQLFAPQQISDNQKASFIKLSLAQSLMSTMGNFTGTVIESDIQAITKIIESATNQYLSKIEIRSQIAVNTIINTSIKSNIKINFTKNSSLEELMQKSKQISQTYQTAITTGNTTLLKDYLNTKELQEFTDALADIPKSIRSKLASDINAISYNITYKYLANKIEKQKQPLDAIVNKVINSYSGNINKYIFTTSEHLAKDNNAAKTSLNVLDRLYDPKGKIFQWAAVNRAQNTKTTMIIASSIAITVGTVGTASALAPAQATFLATMLSGKTAAAAIGGGLTLTGAQEAINSIYGDATWQDKGLSNDQKFNKLFVDFLKNSLSMYGAIAGGVYSKGLDAAAKEGIMTTFKATVKAIGFDIAEGTVTTTAQTVVELTDKIISGEEINWSEVAKGFKSELKMNLMMAVVGNLAGLGIENATKAAKRLYQEAMQLRFKQITDKISIRTNDGKISEQLTQQLGEKNASRIFGLTSEAKMKQQEFLSIDYVVGDTIETITFWGDQYTVDFDAAKLPKDATITAVFHGGPHATGMSLEDQNFYKLLSKDATINHIDTGGSGSVTQFTSRSRTQNLDSAATLHSSNDVTIAPKTKNLERARNQNQLDEWVQQTSLNKAKEGPAYVRQLQDEFQKTYDEYKMIYGAISENPEELIKKLEKNGHGSELIKKLKTDKEHALQYITKEYQIKLSDIDSQYRRQHSIFLLQITKQERLTLSQDAFANRVEDLNQALKGDFYNLKNMAETLKAQDIIITTNRLESSVNFLSHLIDNIDDNIAWIEKNPQFDKLNSLEKLKTIKDQAAQIKGIVNDEILAREAKNASSTATIWRNK